jgi:hypothetical protein
MEAIKRKVESKRIWKNSAESRENDEKEDRERKGRR